MMTISPAGVGYFDMASVSGSNSKSKEQMEGVDSFATLMNMGSSNSTDNIDFDKVDEIKPVDNAEEIDKEAEYASDDVYNKTVEPEKADSPEKVSDIPKKSKYDTDDNEVSVENLKQVIAENNSNNEIELEDGELADILSKLQEIIREILNKAGVEQDAVVTDEDIEKILAEMNINVEDLLSTSNLKEFILKVNNSTEVDILINEKLANVIEEATTQIDNILAEQEVTDAGDFIAKLKVMMFKDEKAKYAEATKVEEGVLLEDAEVDSLSSKENITNKENILDKENVINKATNADKNIEINVMDDFSQSSFGYEEFSDTKNQIFANLNQAVDSALNVNSTLEAVSFVDNSQQLDIIRQIVDNIKLNISKETTSMELQLNPEHLGKVHINVASKDGILQAQIVAETEAAKNAIEGSLAVLKEAFQNQELKVEAIEVMVATYEFFNQSDAGQKENENTQSKKTGVINLGDFVEDELTDNELIELEIMKAKGNSVSYTV